MTLLNHGKTEDGQKYYYDVTIDAEQFNGAVDAAYKKLVKKIEIDGFRKGKAPKAFIEAKYGEDFFFDEALDMLLPECYSECLKAQEIDIIDRPSVDVKKIDKQNGVELRFEVLLRPELTVKKFKGLTAEKKPAEVTEEQVDKEIEDMRTKQSRMISVEDRPAQDGDTALIDFEGFVDDKAFEGGKAEKYSLQLGSGQFIEGFEAQIIGKSIGDEFDVNVTFPEDYGAKELAGKPAVFKVKLHELRFRELPELDDEFAKDCDFDTLAAMRESIKSHLTEHAEHDADEKFENDLMEELVKELEGEVPDVMVQNRIDELVDDFEGRFAQQGLKLQDYLKYTGSDLESFRKSFEERAVAQVKTRLALEAVARAEKLAVTPEEIEDEFKKTAERYEVDVEEVKKHFTPHEVEGDLLANKALDFVKENAKIKK